MFEQLNALNKQIEDLTKQANDLVDTLAKQELAKNRFRELDYGTIKYILKVNSVNENNCTVTEFMFKEDNFARCQKSEQSFKWLLTSTAISEEQYNKVYQEFLDYIKL